MGITVDVDDLEGLGDDLQTLAGFLDGGTPLGTGDATSPDIAERVENLQDHLGGSMRVPSLLTNDNRVPSAQPWEAVDSFSSNWEDVRAELAKDIREVGAMLQAAGRGYEYEDEDLAFRTWQAPPAEPVIGEPSLTG